MRSKLCITKKTNYTAQRSEKGKRRSHNRTIIKTIIALRQYQKELEVRTRLKGQRAKEVGSGPTSTANKKNTRTHGDTIRGTLFEIQLKYPKLADVSAFP